MKVSDIKQFVYKSIDNLPIDKIERLINLVKERDILKLNSPSRMRIREVRLNEAESRPSPASLERLLGKNDLVDINYLHKAIQAAKSICRIIIRDSFGRDIGYATGFKISPNLMMTNQHVFTTKEEARNAIAEFNYELDLMGQPKPVVRFQFDPDKFFTNEITLDYAVIAISPVPVHGNGSLDDFGYLKLKAEKGKINKGEFVTIIQHPSGLPKQVALRENQLLELLPLKLLYYSDTAQGSSGSPLFNDSWEVVGLHHSGVPKTDENGKWLLKNGSIATDDDDDSDVDWVANEGFRISEILDHLSIKVSDGPIIDEFWRTTKEESPILQPQGGAVTVPPVMGANSGILVQPVQGGAKLTIPVTLNISLDGNYPSLSAITGTTSNGGPAADRSAAIEAFKQPYVDPNYGNRAGFNPKFLGLEVPLPLVLDQDSLAKLDNGETLIPYHHFSVALNKRRRLAFFTASNIDANALRKQPDKGKDYTRNGLGELGKNDKEQWRNDPRIPDAFQLPDRFYTSDGGAFDKGHIVRREDVCWGSSYQEVKNANGDTYHTTNCSPQVADFNRSANKADGAWGKLENFILKQAKAEKYCVLAGPCLKADDRFFQGKDERGLVKIQIPSGYWKIVVAQKGKALQAFAFLLQQDLENVPLEFVVSAAWKEKMVAIQTLESELGYLRFPDALKDADQFGQIADVEGYVSSE